MAEDKTKILAQFLKNTYELVEDPNTNELISWKYSNQTFIVWDHIKFSSLLLPQYFRHDNFSSFVCQLNNYGFRKVNNIPYEYYNEWFQPGRKDLLYNIKKRPQVPQTKKHKDLKTFRLIATEYETLKVGHKKLKIEIDELRQEQKSLEKQLASVNSEEVKEEEEIVNLVVKALSDPSFIQQVIERLCGDEMEESGEMVTEKLRLGKETDNVKVSFEPNDAHGAEKSLREGSKIEDLPMILPNLNSGNCFALAKILFDDIYIEKDSQGEVAQDESNIMLELKDLITKPPDPSCNKTSNGEKEDGCKRGVNSMMLLSLAAEDVQKT